MGLNTLTILILLGIQGCQCRISGHGLSNLNHETDDFIVTLPKQYAHELRNFLKNNLSGPQYVRTIDLKGSTMVFVRGNITDMENLSHLPFLMDGEIEQNHKINLIEPVHSSSVDITSTDFESFDFDSEIDNETCNAQYGLNLQDGWGLIRTSYSKVPSYESSPYIYENDGSGVNIYVLDTGIDIHQEDFTGRAELGMISTAHQKEGPEDIKGHGTHVAGIVVGRKYGVAKGATVVSCKILDQTGGGTLEDAVEGIAWVTDQVIEKKAAGKPARAIINLSLGGTTQSTALKRAIDNAIIEGIIFVVAAGNTRSDAGYFYPGAYSNTISVASSTNTDQFSSFSNYGPKVDLIAPGSSIIAAGSEYSRDCINKSRPRACFVKKSGTSMAAPHVSGIIARYLSGLTDEEAGLVTQTQVMEMLNQTATRGIISFTNQRQNQTPNILLHRHCEYHYETTMPAPSGSPIFWPTRRLIILIFCMGVLFNKFIH